jgi:hypothetical protein
VWTNLTRWPLVSVIVSPSATWSTRNTGPAAQAVDATTQAAITAQVNHKQENHKLTCLPRMPAATPRILFVLSLHLPVALRSPDQQPNPDGHADQADDATEEDDSGHTPIMAGPDTSRETA